MFTAGNLDKLKKEKELIAVHILDFLLIFLIPMSRSNYIHVLLILKLYYTYDFRTCLWFIRALYAYPHSFTAQLLHTRWDLCSQLAARG